MNIWIEIACHPNNEPRVKGMLAFYSDHPHYWDHGICGWVETDNVDVAAEMNDRLFELKIPATVFAEINPEEQ